jgi:DNA-binding transcriptional LysR family regulator
VHAVQLSAIDLNLLVALRALLATRNVTRAGRRVGLSPSAMSHALARLREALADPLLVRAGRQMLPTPRALALQEPLDSALGALEHLLVPQLEFSPRALERGFSIATTEHAQSVLLRHADAILRAEGPAANLYFQSLPPDTFGRLREGTLDLAVAVYPTTEPDIERAPLFADHLVAVVRRGHPALRGRMTLERFAGYEHVLVAPNGTPTGLVDRLLAERKLKRRVARTSATFFDIAFLVADADYIVSLPQTFVQPLLKRLDLRMLELPLQLPSFTHSMIWHRRNTDDPAHSWLRAVVARAAVAATTRKGARRQRKARPTRK